jgi:uncharacterized protein YdeI (YjbR/CyaY-like superfamily)
MGKKDPRVDVYIQTAPAFAQPILKRIRKAMHAGCPDVAETMKWSTPHFDYKGVVAGMSAFKEHAALGFWKSELLGLGRLGGGEGRGRYGRLTSVDDLPSETQLVALVKKAATLNEEGVKVERPARPARSKTVDVPAYFTAALKRNKKALANFEAFSPSHKREYVEWITEAKSEGTRERRMAQAIEWIAAGKSRNWKYAR